MTVRCLSRRAAAAALAVSLGGAAAASADVLTLVPMQGGMAMPMVSWNTNLAKLDVEMPPEVPQLTPLLVSNPGDSFDPADPWYTSLDPSRQGLAFSRRYGFVMGMSTNRPPAGTQIWLRKLAGPPELEAYRYAASAPKAWEPIFGTAGTSNALYWNGMMFHPCFAAPPGTNSWAATFEVFLVDTNAGLEVAGAASGPLVFNWTDAPDGRPTLGIGLRAAIAWDAGTTNYVLESASSPAAADWTAVTNAPVLIDGRPTVLPPAGEASRCYRMRPIP